jgi:hypothetical protein
MDDAQPLAHAKAAMHASVTQLGRSDRIDWEFCVGIASRAAEGVGGSVTI